MKDNGLFPMKKIYFEKLFKDSKVIKYYFTSYLRLDFVEQSVVITVNENSKVKEIYFSSHEFGSVSWINDSGLQDCHVWETSEQAEEPTYLTRRFTMRLADGAAPVSHAVEKIIPDVLENMADVEISKILKKIIKRTEYNKEFDFKDYEFFRRKNTENKEKKSNTGSGKKRFKKLLKQIKSKIKMIKDG